MVNMDIWVEHFNFSLKVLKMFSSIFIIRQRSNSSQAQNSI